MSADAPDDRLENSTSGPVDEIWEDEIWETLGISEARWNDRLEEPPFPWDFEGIPKEDWVTNFRKARIQHQNRLDWRSREDAGKVIDHAMAKHNWDAILEIKSIVENETDDDIVEFRQSLERLVESTGHIRTAVCLGLGDFEVEFDTTSFIHQCAVFLVLCDMISKKQGKSVPQIYQDPLHRKEEKYLLRTLAKGKVVREPGALSYINEHAFLYGIHLPYFILVEAVLEARPMLYIGNPITVNVELITGRTRLVHRDQADQLDRIVQLSEQFCNSYRKELFGDEYQETMQTEYKIFGDTYDYIREHGHPDYLPLKNITSSELSTENTNEAPVTDLEFGLSQLQVSSNPSSETKGRGKPHGEQEEERGVEDKIAQTQSTKN